MLLHLGGFKSLIGFNVIGDPSPAMRWVTLFVMSYMYLVFFAVDLPSYEVGDIICDVLLVFFAANLPSYEVGDVICDVYLVFFAVDLPSYKVGDVICDVLPGIFCCRPPQL